MMVWCILMVTVDWEYERKLVQRSVENLVGVRGIS